MNRILIRDANNKPIIAEVVNQGPTVTIRIAPNHLVKKDNPSFANSEGGICLNVTKSKYKEAYATIRSYFEGILLKTISGDDWRDAKGVLENDNRNTSIGRTTKRKRNKKSDRPIDPVENTGERGAESVHSSPRGDEPTA